MKPRAGALILLFGLTAAQEKSVRTAGLQWGLRCRAVPAAHYNRTMTQLLTGKSDAADYDGPVPDVQALLLAGIPGSILQPFLQKLRKAGLPASVMKAVLTEQNSGWTALTLLEELQREHAALTAGENTVHMSS